MELTHLKYTNNTHKPDKLPGYLDGRMSVNVGGANYTYDYKTSNEWLTRSMLILENQNPTKADWIRSGVGIVNGAKNPTSSVSTEPITQNGITDYTPNGVSGKENFNSQQGAAQTASGAGMGFAIGGWLGGGVVNGIDRIYNQYDPTNLIAEAGNSNANIGGISYNRQNVVDAERLKKQYDNQGRMDWWTSPGSAITAIFGRSKARAAADLALMKSTNIAADLTAGALTKSLRLNNAKLLAGAKNGKLPNFEYGSLPTYANIPGISNNIEGFQNKPVWTVFGPLVGIEPNAKVSKGETLYKKDVFGNVVAAQTVAGKPNNNDTEYAYLGPNYEDGVVTNKKGASKVAQTGNFDLAESIMKSGKTGGSYGDLLSAKCGKLPKYAEGGWGNAVTSGIGMLSGLGQMISAYMNKPYRPNTYVDNPYEMESLNTLSGLHINPYPIIQEMRNAESRTNRAIDRSGGLSTALRGLSRLSALYGTQNNIANTLASILNQNNQYKASYASTALNAGANNAQRRMAANQWDLDYFSKAHAARLGGMQTGIQNMLAQAQNWYRNDFKRRQFNDTMALYKLEQKNTAAANEAMRLYNQQLIDMLKQQYMSEDWWRLYGKQKGWLS